MVAVLIAMAPPNTAVVNCCGLYFAIWYSDTNIQQIKKCFESSNDSSNIKLNCEYYTPMC
jgi:hypothetical protein